jgi:hypothetical protein
MKRA